jgi:hypothetical protein
LRPAGIVEKSVREGSKGAITVHERSTNPFKVTGTLTLTAKVKRGDGTKRTIAVGSATFSVPKNSKVPVKVALTKAAKGLLKTHKSLGASARTVTRGNGQTAPEVQALTIDAPK